MLRAKTSRGDTIIEVLIAIAIAGLAIATAYSIANKSLQKAVAARERDKAIGLLEGQVNALKLRYIKSADAASFASTFTSIPNFCLDATTTDPSVNWGPIVNTAATPLTSSNYNTAYCVQDAQNKIYYLNITIIPDTGSSNQADFRLDVRWPRLGGGNDNDATFYYRF